MAEEQHHHKGLEINAVLVGLLGVIAGAIIVVILHCIIVTWCKSTSTSSSTSLNTTNPVTERQNGPLTSIQEEMISSTTTSTSTSTSTSSSASTRKDNSMVQVIVLSRYKKDCKEDMCSICLGEFIEGDEIRVLSQCMHFFHVPCIDTWLHSHWNCPLCRSDATSALPQRRLTGLMPESQEANL